MRRASLYTHTHTHPSLQKAPPHPTKKPLIHLPGIEEQAGGAESGGVGGAFVLRGIADPEKLSLFSLLSGFQFTPIKRENAAEQKNSKTFKCGNLRRAAEMQRRSDAWSE